MGMYEFRLPDVGEGLHEAEIGNWLVAVGDIVKLDQPVLEVETDKSVVELPAPVAGRIVQLGAETGTLAQVGDLLLVIEPLDRKGQPEPSILVKTAVSSSKIGLPGPDQRILAAPSVRKFALELDVDLTAVSGTGPAGRILVSDVKNALAGKGVTGSQQQSTENSQKVAKVLAAPAVRRMAQVEGIDLTQVVGTAENGRVTQEDLAEFMAQQKSTPAKDVGVITTPTEPSVGSQRVPLRGIRRSMAHRMELAWQTIPHVTNFEDIDATQLVHLRQLLQEDVADRGLKLTYLPLITKIVAQLLTEFPDFNASIDTEKQEIIYHNHVHIGMATATPDGLLVPVIKNANHLTLFQLIETIQTLATQARERQLPREALRGSTFTITNFGSFGGNLGTPIINPPEVAILGSGQIAKKPVAVSDELVIRPILPLALSFDHRLIDGAMAGSFLTRLRQLLEMPQRLLLDMK